MCELLFLRTFLLLYLTNNLSSFRGLLCYFLDSRDYLEDNTSWLFRSLCNYLVWILGYVEFDLSVLELRDSKINPKPVSIKPRSRTH